MTQYQQGRDAGHPKVCGVDREQSSFCYAICNVILGGDMGQWTSNQMSTCVTLDLALGGNTLYYLPDDTALLGLGQEYILVTKIMLLSAGHWTEKCRTNPLTRRHRHLWSPWLQGIESCHLILLTCQNVILSYWNVYFNFLNFNECFIKLFKVCKIINVSAKQCPKVQN